MSAKGRGFQRLGVALAILSIAAMSSAAASGKRPFETKDSIEMSYFGTLGFSQPPDLDDDGILSPDRRWIVKVTHRGILPDGVTEGRIWLFDAVAMQRSVNHPRVPVLPPVPIATMSGAVNGFDFLADRGNTIYQVKWTGDSRSVTFLGRDHQENHRLFQVDVRTREVTALTPVTQDVADYVTTKTGFVYFAAADRREEQELWSMGPGIPDIQVGAGSSLGDLLYPHWPGDACCKPVGMAVWRVIDGRATPIVNGETGHPVTVIMRYGVEVMGLTPDERRLAIIAYDGVPPPRSDESLHYRVIDLNTGTSETLLEEPVVSNHGGYAGRYRAVWSPDASAVAMSELNDSGHSDATNSAAMCEAGILKIAAHQFECVIRSRNPSPGVLYSMYWTPSGQLGLRYRQWGNGLYEDQLVDRKRGRWFASMRQMQPRDLPLQLTVREGLNDPPVLLATDTDTDKERVVFDPNPQLADIDLGVVSVYEWKDAHGRTVKGGLAKPPGFVRGQRYSLVIQTHGFDPHQFFRVGFGETVNAGRALAGRGMMVLQVAEPYAPYYRTSQAAMENGTNVYLAAIDKLDKEGLIDPKKVGATGYSATGLFVSSAITRAPERFVAAALSNTDNGSLSGYFGSVDNLNPEVPKLVAEEFAGARPYGEGLNKWIERAPGLSTDKITAAVLLSPTSPLDLSALWSLYAALRDQGKAVELQYIRSGRHNLSKPLQRLAQQEMLVDWFDFWLNGHEDPSQSKSAQYERWRKLRELRATQESAAAQ
jgi:hypothetical protein